MEFLATLEVPAVAAFIARSDVMYVVAESGDALAGAAALRGHRSVEHLFVDVAYLRMGLGRRLWETLRDAALQGGNPGVFSVHCRRMNRIRIQYIAGMIWRESPSLKPRIHRADAPVVSEHDRRCRKYASHRQNRADLRRRQHFHVGPFTAENCPA